MYTARDGQEGSELSWITSSIEVGLSEQGVASFISHEFGNPASIIKGFLDVVLDGKAGPLTPLQLEFLGLAGASANKVCSLIDDIADLRLAARGDLRLELQEIRLERILEKVITQLLPVATSRQILLENQFPENVPYCLLDTKRITRVLFHLLNYALKFAPARSQLLVSAEVIQERITLYIAGLPSDVLSGEYLALFGKTPIGDMLCSGKYDATVLGLEMANYVVKRHRGEMWMDERPNGCARIALSLPISVRLRGETS